MKGFKVSADQIEQIREALLAMGFTESTNNSGFDYAAPKGGKIRVYNNRTIHIQGKEEEDFLHLGAEP